MVHALLIFWSLIKLLHCSEPCTILSILRCHMGCHSRVMGPRVLLTNSSLSTLLPAM